MWSLVDGLVCEDVRGGESEFCIVTAENFMVTKRSNSDVYSYSETGFQSDLTISTGDTLGLDLENTAFTQITEATINTVFDKQLFFFDEGNNVQTANFIVVRENGTFDGTWESEPIAGTWEMRDGNWCRILTAFFNADRLNSEDCQLWERSGIRIRGTRDGGAGVSFIYNIGE